MPEATKAIGPRALEGSGFRLQGLENCFGGVRVWNRCAFLGFRLQGPEIFRVRAFKGLGFKVCRFWGSRLLNPEP